MEESESESNSVLTYEEEMKILNFEAITECRDGRAAEILRRNNWDETAAAQEYLAREMPTSDMRDAGPYADIYGGLGQTTSYVPDISRRPIPGSGGMPPEPMGEGVRAADEYRSEALIDDYGGWGRGYYDDMYDQGGISLGGVALDGIKAIGGGIKALWNWFLPSFLRGKSAGGEEFIAIYNKKFKNIPHPNFIIGTLEEAGEQARAADKPLFLYIHDTNTRNNTDLKSWLVEVLGSVEIISLLNENYVCLGLESNTTEGRRVANKFTVQEMPYMGILHTPNTPGTREGLLLEFKTGIEITLEQLVEFLIYSIDTRNLVKNENMGVIPERDILSPNYGIREENRRNMGMEYEEFNSSMLNPSNYHQRPSEREESKEEEIPPYLLDSPRDFSLEEEAIKQEEKELQEREQINNLNKLKKLAELKAKFEVEDEGTDAAKISFRTPSGARITHKFNKFLKIEVLFEYLESLEIFESEGLERDSFNLVQPIKKERFDREMTIMEAKLFPTALLIIKPINP